jgi:hypothetical protein
MLGMTARQLPSKVVAKLELGMSEVKRRQSLEESQTLSYPSPLSPRDMIDRVIGTKRTFGVLTAAGAVLAFSAACGDFTSVPASLPTLTDSGTVYAINGAPPGAPTALHLFSGSRLAADANFFFDVAFDIDASGNIVLLPQRVVASGLASTHSVGFQAVAQDFAAVDKALKSGYRADTAHVTRPGQTVLIQSQDVNACSISITGTVIYAKLVVLSLDRAARRISIQYTVDPNCGFLSFASGVPKE